MDSIPGTLPVTNSAQNLSSILSAIPVVVIIVDNNQRVVWGHQQLLDLIGADKPPACAVPGPGDLLACVNATSAPAGCGSGPGCGLCGAMAAMRESDASGEVVTRECRIVVHDREGQRRPLDLVATAAPYSAEDTMYTMLTLQDASAEKRRRALERVFFHDILNTAGGLSGLVGELRQTDDPGEREMMLGLLESSARSLLEEISAQRQLSSAEQGELVPRPRELSVKEVLEDVRAILRHHPVGSGRRISLDGHTNGDTMVTDATLLRRVLLNLAKNAVEACSPDELVELRFTGTAGRALFTVQNPGYIPREVQLQLFYRSFSTKGPGRGLGTYSARLLTEQYLNGTITFTTSPDEGTCFTVALPR